MPLEIQTNEPHHSILHLSPDDDRFREVAQRLAMGFPPTEAVYASFPHEFYENPSAKDPTPDEIEFIHAVSTHPVVTDLHRAILKEDVPAHSLSLDEKLAYIRSAVLTPAGLVTKDSPLCQSYKETTNEKTGITTTEIKMVDKMKCLDMDSKLKAHYAEDHGSQEASATLLEVLQKARALSE